MYGLGIAILIPLSGLAAAIWIGGGIVGGGIFQHNVDDSDTDWSDYDAANAASKERSSSAKKNSYEYKSPSRFYVQRFYSSRWVTCSGGGGSENIAMNIAERIKNQYPDSSVRVIECDGSSTSTSHGTTVASL